MNAHEFVGIDVAKAVLDVAARPGGDTWQVTNDEAGIVELVAQLEALGAGLVVCEATGGEDLNGRFRGVPLQRTKTRPWPRRATPDA